MANGVTEGVGKTTAAQAKVIQEGTVEHPIGREADLEGRKGVEGRNASILKGEKETVFRVYTPKNEQAFKNLNIDPNYTAVRTSANDIFFMRKDAAKAYVQLSRGARAGITNLEWRNNKITIVEKDAFKDSQPSLAELRKGKAAADKKPAGTEKYNLSVLAESGIIRRVKIPGGGVGYIIAAETTGGRDYLRNEFAKAGHSSHTIRGREYWMSQEQWQKRQSK
jgi:hypothetical protein